MAMLSVTRWSRGQIPESQQRKLLSVVSRGLGVADPACLLPERQRLWDVVPTGRVSLCWPATLRCVHLEELDQVPSPLPKAVPPVSRSLFA